MRFLALALIPLLLLVATLTPTWSEWTYQLDKPDPNVVITDTVVLDPRNVSVEQVASFKLKRITTIAYLAIDDVPGGFWQSEWQNKLFRSKPKLMDAVVEAGFDGILLDKIDVAVKDHKDAFAKFLVRLNANAIEINPKFKIYVPDVGALDKIESLKTIIAGFKPTEVKPVDMSPTPPVASDNPKIKVPDIKLPDLPTFELPKVAPPTVSELTEWWRWVLVGLAVLLGLWVLRNRSV